MLLTLLFVVLRIPCHAKYFPPSCSFHLTSGQDLVSSPVICLQPLQKVLYLQTSPVLFCYILGYKMGMWKNTLQRDFVAKNSSLLLRVLAWTPHKITLLLTNLYFALVSSWWSDPSAHPGFCQERILLNCKYERENRRKHYQI